MTTTTEPTYNDLVDRYQATIALRQKIERRLRGYEPGTPEGYQWYLTLQRCEESEREQRNAVRNHPDAPAQG